MQIIASRAAYAIANALRTTRCTFATANRIPICTD